MDIAKEMATYIHLSKYSRWLAEKSRRETWEETVDRYVDYWEKRKQIEPCDAIEIGDAIANYEVMPSMRCMMTAGPALDADNAAGYNCWGKSVDHPRVFDEVFYLLMCGGGVGFSVERQYINKLPEVPDELHKTDSTIKVADSRIGWATAYKQLIAFLYSGDIPKWDVSGVRPAGSRLVTFGGRASGPAPLESLFKYTVRIFQKAKGRKLRSIDCHDLLCKVANAVVAGSVRRSACISLSNLSDDRMRRAKMGQWWDCKPERALANNSVMYTEKPDMESFTKELRSIYKSKAGERGIVNQEALYDKALLCERNDYNGSYLLNPCGEAILRATGQACNLSEVVVRPEDTLDSLKEKVRIATVIGTLQATLTDFRYIRKVWKDNIKEERLLGISLTGIMDHPVMSGQERYWNVIHEGFICGDVEAVKFATSLGYKAKLGDTIHNIKLNLEDTLAYLKETACETNILWSDKLGIPASKQLTLVKPSGTVSQLCGTSSGIHPRFAAFSLRRVTQDRKDPLTDMMISEGIPHVESGENVLFEFPMKSPKGSVTQDQIDAVGQLELWKIYQEYWCDGNPSQTIYYTDDTFLDVQKWLWDNWKSVGGLSFFPVDDNIYENPPNEVLSESEYLSLVDKFPEVDWSRLAEFEQEDCTTGSQELACAGGQCEL